MVKNQKSSMVKQDKVVPEEPNEKMECEMLNKIGKIPDVYVKMMSMIDELKVEAETMINECEGKHSKEIDSRNFDKLNTRYVSIAEIIGSLEGIGDKIFRCMVAIRENHVSVCDQNDHYNNDDDEQDVECDEHLDANSENEENEEDVRNMNAKSDDEDDEVEEIKMKTVVKEDVKNQTVGKKVVKGKKTVDVDEDTETPKKVTKKKTKTNSENETECEKPKGKKVTKQAKEDTEDNEETAPKPVKSTKSKVKSKENAGDESEVKKTKKGK